MSTPATPDLPQVIAEIKRAVDASGADRETMSKALDGLRSDFAEIKRATDQAALDAATRPVGRDADFSRAYVGAPTHKRATTEPGKGSLGGHVTHLSIGDATPVRFVGGTDDLGDYHPGVLDDPAPKTEWQAELQRLSAIRSIGGLMGVAMGRTDKRIARHLRKGPTEIARMFADNSTEGAEFMPTAVSAMLDRYASLPRAAANLFEQVSISGVDVVNPFVTTGAVPKLGIAPVAGDNNPAVIAVGNPVTADRTMTASTFLVNILASMDASEDSIVAFAPWAINEIAIALADGYEDALINGDSTSTHEDTISAWTGGGRWPSTGMGGADDHRRAFKGLRRKASDASAASDGSAADTVSGAIAMRNTLGGAHRAGDLAYIVSMGNLIAKLLTDSNFLTVDKAGALATMLTGQIGSIGGYPVVISEFLTEDLNATGLFDNATTTYTGMLLVNRAQFKRVLRQGQSTEISRFAHQNAVYLTGKARQGFHSVQASTTKSVSYRYKLAKT